MSDISSSGTTALIAIALMPLISYIKKPTWSSKTNYGVGMAAALLAAVVGALVDGNVNSASEALQLVLIAIGSAQSVYNLYFINTSVNDKLTGM